MLAVAIEVIMILSIVAIFMGMLNDQKERTNGIGADLMLLPSNASLFNGVSGASMPSPRRGSAAPVCPMSQWFRPPSRTSPRNGNVEILYGIDYASFDALKPFIFLAGGRFQGPNDVIVDDVFAGSRNPATEGRTRWATPSRSWTAPFAFQESSSRAREGAS